MNKEDLLKLMQDVGEKRISPEDAARKVETLPYQDLGFAKVDYHRAVRAHSQEVIFCLGKSEEQVAGIVRNMIENGAKNILATRASAEVYNAVCEVESDAEYNAAARTIVVRPEKIFKTEKKIAVVTDRKSVV